MPIKPKFVYGQTKLTSWRDAADAIKESQFKPRGGKSIKLAERLFELEKLVKEKK